MQIKEINIETIKPYVRNAKKHGEVQIKNISESIKQFGFRQPIVLDKNMEIVIGHGRFEAAKKLGMKTVPCIMADDLSDEQIKKLRVIDNKVNESEWDLDLLSLDIMGIDFSDFDIELPNFSEEKKPDEVPTEFKEYGDDIETKCKCPRCGYEW